MFGLTIRKEIRDVAETFKEDERWKVAKFGVEDPNTFWYKDSKGSACLVENKANDFFKIVRTGVNGITNREMRYLKRKWDKYNNAF